MKAERLSKLLDGRGDADIYVDVKGFYIPVVSARYDPQPHNQVIIGLDKFKLFQVLAQLKHPNDGEQP